MLEQVKSDLLKLENPESAKILSKFFKTGKGEYGEGDIFLGITVPDQRKISKKYFEMPLRDVQKLLSSKVHERRFTALLMLVEKFNRADDENKKAIVYFYLKNTKNINNWDLVDMSSSQILGNFLFDKDKSILYKLASSPNVWERRISIISTSAFIRRNKFDDTFRISEMLLKDRHDLIHKAVGWMLREVGKRSQAAEERFLKKHCREMPRTMLRYAIEKLSDEKRSFYLSGKKKTP